MPRSDPLLVLREEHGHLLTELEHVRRLAHEVARLEPRERAERLEPVLSFLEGTLLPHAEAEEAALYPAVARLLGDSRSTAPMIHDHRVLREHASALAATDPADAERLAELLFGVYALTLSHFRKEEELYVPLLEEHPEEAALVATSIDAQPGHAH